VDYPRTAFSLSQRLDSGIAPRTVLWLGEFRDYVEVDGAAEILSQLVDLLASNGQVIVLTTLWPDQWALYTDTNYSITNTANVVAISKGLLIPLPELHAHDNISDLDPAHGAVIDIPSQFTDAEIADALQLGDAAIQEAVAATRVAGSDGQVAQYLSGAPDLINHYKGSGVNPYGRAIITASMDASRLGYVGTHPAELLKSAVIGYLAPRERTADLLEWWDSALTYATRELKGAVQALEPIPPQDGYGVAGYKLADYLDQYGRRERRADLGPASIWDAMFAHTRSSGALERLGDSACARGLYRHAAIFWTKAVREGSTGAALRLIELLRNLDPDSARRAAQWSSDYINFSDARAVAELLIALRTAGAHEAVTKAATAAAGQVGLRDAGAVGKLLSTFNSFGARNAVDLLLARDPVRHADLTNALTANTLLKSLERVGATDAVLALLARVPIKSVSRSASAVSADARAGAAVQIAMNTEINDIQAVARTLQTLKALNAYDIANDLAVRTAQHVDIADPVAVASLLDVLYKAEVTGAITILLARDPVHEVSLNNPAAITNLLRALRRVKASNAAISLIERTATDARTTDPSLLAMRLISLSTASSANALDSFKIQAARDASLHNAAEVGELLQTLRNVGATDALNELAYRCARKAALYTAHEVGAWLAVLLQAGAPDAAGILADRAAHRPDINNPWAISKWLAALRDAEATEAVIKLTDRVTKQAARNDSWVVARWVSALRTTGDTDLARDIIARAAAEADLGDPQAVASWIRDLQEAGAADAVDVLLSRRPAQHAQLHDPDDVYMLIAALQDVDAADASTELAMRASEAGLTSVLMRRIAARTKIHKYGQEPNGVPSPAWQWNKDGAF
jgi:hypothetical protein